MASIPIVDPLIDFVTGGGGTGRVVNPPGVGRGGGAAGRQDTRSAAALLQEIERLRRTQTRWNRLRQQEAARAARGSREAQSNLPKIDQAIAQVTRSLAGAQRRYSQVTGQRQFGPQRPSSQPSASGGTGPGTSQSGGEASSGDAGVSEGSFGGGGTVSATGVGASPDDVQAYVMENYPQFAWLINQPEMLELFKRAMSDGWSVQKFNLELQKTTWWRTTSESVRKWEALKATDPAQAGRLLTQSTNTLADSALRLGAEIDPQTLTQLSEHAIRFGWTAEETQDAIVNHIDFVNPRFGLAAGARQQVERMMGDYVVRLSEDQQQRWARQLLTGGATEETMRNYFVEQAGSFFPSLKGALARGDTVRGYADPYLQDTAAELGISPESIDLLDPKWNRFLTQIDAEGNPVQMTRWEWLKTVRTDPTYGWEFTDTAHDRAAPLKLGLLQTFGQVAG